MLPKDRDLFAQDAFITGFLSDHFSEMNSAGIRYLFLSG
jgi:hypothetical protein